MKKIYVSILAATLTAMAGLAQDNLQKEITLPKDFVPVVKKATKKSALPRVLKPVKGNEKSEINFTDWAEPTAVSVEIPTMLPYGYRTSHRFSSQRGYFDAGAGTQLNFVGSAGYRLVDNETLKLDAWAQHNSTWTGRNSSPLSSAKQKFCDNTIGVDMTKTATCGDLSLGAKVHFDKFNYYGLSADDIVGDNMSTDKNNYWFGHDQSLLDVTVHGAWNGKVNVSRFHDISYKVGAAYNYAGYGNGFASYGLENYIDPTYYNGLKGAKEHHFQANLGLKYGIEASSSVGLDAAIDVLNRSHYEINTMANCAFDKISDGATMVTLSPFYTYFGQNLLARLGVNVNLSFSDGTAFRLAPNMQLAYEFTPGVSLYANAEGGKRLNTLSRIAAINRYLDPNGRYANTFIPIDAEAGFKIGPFSGVTAKAFFGYGIFKDNLESLASAWSAGTQLLNSDSKGWKAGATLNMKLRSAAEVKLAFTYAPQDDKFEYGKSYKGYMLGFDRAKMVANADLNLFLFKGFTIGAGFEYRGKRHFVENEVAESTEGAPVFRIINMNDVMNLHAGASYRFDKYLTLWVKASNLLNKQWDVLYSLGAQKLTIMGGIGLVF